MPEPTKAQMVVLGYLQRHEKEGALPSSHMRTRDVLNPGAVLARLAKRRLVEALGVHTDNSRCYRITPLGRQVLAETREGGRG